MQTLAPGWELDVRRGPGWLLVKLGHPGTDSPHSPPLADQLWSVLEQHLVYRVILELDEIPMLDRPLLGQLVQLCRRIRQHDGMLRLCGLSPLNRQMIESCRLSDRFPTYDDVTEAIMGMSRKPR